MLPSSKSYHVEVPRVAASGPATGVIKAGKYNTQVVNGAISIRSVNVTVDVAGATYYLNIPMPQEIPETETRPNVRRAIALGNGRFFAEVLPALGVNKQEVKALQEGKGIILIDADNAVELDGLAHWNGQGPKISLVGRSITFLVVAPGDAGALTGLQVKYSIPVALLLPPGELDRLWQAKGGKVDTLGAVQRLLGDYTHLRNDFDFAAKYQAKKAGNPAANAQQGGGGGGYNSGAPADDAGGSDPPF